MTLTNTYQSDDLKGFSTLRRSLVQLLWLMAALLLGQTTVQAAGGQTIDSAEIIKESLNTDCFDYEIVGGCVWLKCTPFGCKTSFSPVQRHYIPEAIVSTYTNTGENPWKEVQFYSKPNSNAEDGGRSDQDFSQQHFQTLRFKNADVIGSPGSLVFKQMASQYVCNTNTQAYMPYFISTIDPQWRHQPPFDSAFSGLITNPKNLLRNVNLGLSNWGNLYPLSGFILQSHDYKAAAVTAQRTAEVVTAANVTNIRIPMKAPSGKGHFDSGLVIEGDDETHKWQQLVPKGDSKQCRVFPDVSDIAKLTDPFGNRLSEDGGYVHQLWRRYTCCHGSGSLIYSYVKD
jgi:integrating conjugative element protein (TIGR03756 family)